MLAIKYALIAGAVGLLVSAATILAIDAYRIARSLVPPPVRWRLASRLAVLAWLPLLPALSIVVVPSGMAGVRVSQISGTLAGTLYPGTHFIVPLIHHVELYTVRDQIFSTQAVDSSKDAADALKVHSKEGLPVGLGISVRYQLDPNRLPNMQNSLPRPVETEVLPAVVANAFRQTISGYLHGHDRCRCHERGPVTCEGACSWRAARSECSFRASCARAASTSSPWNAPTAGNPGLSESRTAVSIRLGITSPLRKACRSTAPHRSAPTPTRGGWSPIATAR